MINYLKNYFSNYALRNVSLLSFSQAVELGAGLVYSVLVVRFLGAVVYGQLLVIISSAKLLDHVLHLKVEEPLTRELRNALDKNDGEKFHSHNTAALVLTLASSAAGLIILLAMNLVEFRFHFFQLEWFFFITIFFLSLFIRHVRNIIFSNFQAAQLFGNLSFLKVTSSLSLNFIPLLFLKHELLGICVGYLTGEAFILISYVFLMRAPFSRRKLSLPTFQYDGEAMLSLFKQSWTYYQAKLADRISGNLSNIIIAYGGGPKSLSFFNIGKKFFRLNIVIFPAIRSYLFPRLVQKWNKRRDEFFYTLKKYLFVSTLSVGTLLALLSLVVPFLIPFFFGREFRPSILVFYVFLPGFLLSVPPGNIFREVCFASDNINVYRTLKVVSNTLFLLLLIPFSYYWTHIGAALAVTCRRGGTGLFDLYWFYRLHRQHESG